ncbi:MAG TPA: hypothetical protein VMC09_05510 [Anaerolineales bacterium]|nr:hypothetical protein [Anaerolineales bacterium]
MNPIPRIASIIYGVLLGLFPRDFQREFKAEMEGVFAASLEESWKTDMILFARICLFELFDLPANLLIVHLSRLRKGIVMQALTSGTRRITAVLLAALSMGFGWVVIALAYQYARALGQDNYRMGDFVVLLAYIVPIALCGLVLGIVAGVDRRTFLRIGLWTTAGGIFGFLADVPVRMINSRILARIVTQNWIPWPSQWYNWVIYYLCMMAVTGTYGFFSCGGLGLAFGGWKACKRFALFGLLANAFGITLASLISTGANTLSSSSSQVLRTIAFSRFYMSTSPYLNAAVLGFLVGGALGWFFGRADKNDTVAPGDELAVVA